ncbi:hypothetical protein [Brevibacillus laterosporus]|nr:hypothetical protein [Brevibacillus laterosporus]
MSEEGAAHSLSRTVEKAPRFWIASMMGLTPFSEGSFLCFQMNELWL